MKYVQSLSLALVLLGSAELYANTPNNCICQPQYGAIPGVVLHMEYGEPKIKNPSYPVPIYSRDSVWLKVFLWSEFGVEGALDQCRNLANQLASLQVCTL
jgi:hypothetical protein